MAERMPPSASRSHPQQHQGWTQRSHAERGSARGVPALFSDAGPYALLRQLGDDMNRLFEEFYGGSGRAGGEGQAGSGGRAFRPALEVCEKDGKLHVYADLPGLSKDDICVDLAADQLTIHGERRSAEPQGSGEGHGGGVYTSERSYGSFYRSVSLPDGIDIDTASATFRDGVLDVSFDAPKTLGRRRTLQISEGGAEGKAEGTAQGEAQRRAQGEENPASGETGGAGGRRGSQA